MSQETTVTENTVPATGTTEVTAATTEVAAAPAAPKQPSKKSLANAIFAALLLDLKAGKFTSNKDFRAAVLTKIQTDLGVSVASAATMYNSAKKDAETADAEVKLGRDPKKEKAPSTGKRGRPAGSKNKDKAETTVVVNTDPAPAEAATGAAAPEAAPEAAPQADPVA